MRPIIIAGNWKMNKTKDEALTFTTELIKQLSPLSTTPSVIIAPPSVYLSDIDKLLKNQPLHLAAQSISEHESGAYTGDIAISMIQSCGATHCIIGHSERRSIHKESNAQLQQKIQLCLKSNITPIYCIGETEQQRNNNETLSILKTQLEEGLQNLDIPAQKLIIAYEPVWAIGTGKVASPEQAQDVHAFIRSQLASQFSTPFSDGTPILYGGSVKPENITSLICQKDIDGALVGGACLKPHTFMEIITKATT